jgi:hypothetical protein
VRSRYPAALAVAQQNRQAVCHHDGAGHAGAGRDARIGLNPIWAGAFQHHAVHAVHLLQKNRPCAQRVVKTLAVGVRE